MGVINDYYTTIKVDEKVFKMIGRAYTLPGSTDREKYLLGNTREVNYLKALGVEVESVTDYFRVVIK